MVKSSDTYTLANLSIDWCFFHSLSLIWCKMDQYGKFAYARFFLFILVSMKLWTNSLLNFETIWSLAIYLFERLIDWCDSELNALCVIYLDSSAYSHNTIRSHVHDVLILCDRKWKIFARDDSNVIITFPRINMVSLSHLQISPNVAHSSIVLVPHYDPTHMF